MSKYQWCVQAWATGLGFCDVAYAETMEQAKKALDRLIADDQGWMAPQLTSHAARRDMTRIVNYHERRAK